MHSELPATPFSQAQDILSEEPANLSPTHREHRNIYKKMSEVEEAKRNSAKHQLWMLETLVAEGGVSHRANPSRRTISDRDIRYSRPFRRYSLCIDFGTVVQLWQARRSW